MSEDKIPYWSDNDFKDAVDVLLNQHRSLDDRAADLLVLIKLLCDQGTLSGDKVLAKAESILSKNL